MALEHTKTTTNRRGTKRVYSRYSRSWAIDTGNGGLIGQFWRFQDWEGIRAYPISQGGLTIAVFQTRAIARKALRFVKGPTDLTGRRPYPKAKVVRIGTVITVNG